MIIMADLNTVFEKAYEINVYNDGVKTTYCAGGEEYAKMLAEWNGLLKGSHLMPAYGVSLHRETTKAINSGLWAEFCFDRVYESGGMPFEKLLIKIEKEYTGFNIIRYNTNYGYDGRCFYIDLVNKNMGGFYDILLNL